MIRTGFKQPTPSAPKVRMRKCAIKTCRKPFPPRSMTHKCCSPECAEEHAKLDRASKERKERQAGLLKFKKRAAWLVDAQTVFNKWVRLRDADKPCICCGKFATGEALTGGKWDAGHYLSRGSHPHLRFDERNVFKQRKSCNMPGGATAAAFRHGVIARIGLEAVEALEADQSVKKWTIDELKEIIAHYRQKIKELKNE